MTATEKDKNRGEQSEEREPTVSIKLEPADEVMFDSLTSEFSEEMITADLREVVKERVRQLYDSREQVARQLAESKQAAALGRQ